MGSAVNVVIVDDDHSLLELSTELLESEGFTVNPFLGAHEAFNYLQGHWASVTLIITDVRMPKMSGAELVIKVRKNSRTLPLVLCSGDESVMEEGYFKNDSNLHFLKKPYLPGELINLVKKVAN
ncbi:MAG: hypothetical protein A2X86_00775 [Bdellovibrionales bacterium GWA2_49_15]|nr:MAG: hypothetical protein A2X86_00775 [Bdellovibrionales bacterium GWA2_49_15]HAZ14605.1 hypothetical protein [Bdellovibrionales bacterium]